jgi:hypothetical protein
MDKTRERNKTIAVLLLAFILYLPLTFLGLGSDCDSYNLMNSVQSLAQKHVYMPSRYPGNPVHELLTTLLYVLGGSLFTNLGSLAMSLVVIYFFIKICEYHKIAHKHLLAIFMIIQPLYYVASTYTIDYFFALGFLLIGYMLLTKKRYLIAGIFWGLAIGTRMSSSLFIIVWLFTYFRNQEADRNSCLLSVGISAIIGASFFILPFLYAGCTFAFFTHYLGYWNLIGHLSRFVFKNVYFWGLQTSLVFLFNLAFILKSLRKNYEPGYRNIITACVLMIIFYEAFFLGMPGDKSYLLPMLPFVLMLLGIALKNYKPLLILLIAVQISYNFININIARPNVPDNATAITVGLWFERGYLVNDIIERMKIKQPTYQELVR